MGSLTDPSREARLYGRQSNRHGEPHEVRHPLLFRAFDIGDRFGAREGFSMLRALDWHPLC